MSILSVGIERGKQLGIEQGKNLGKTESILNLLEENGPVSKTTREMILSETDTARLLIWLKKAAKATSEEDFLKSI